MTAATLSAQGIDIKTTSCWHTIECDDISGAIICAILWDGRANSSLPVCVDSGGVACILQCLGVSPSYIPKYTLTDAPPADGWYSLAADDVEMGGFVNERDVREILDSLMNGWSFRLSSWGAIPPSHVDAIFEAAMTVGVQLPKYKI